MNCQILQWQGSFDMTLPLLDLVASKNMLQLELSRLFFFLFIFVDFSNCALTTNGSQMQLNFKMGLRGSVHARLIIIFEHFASFKQINSYWQTMGKHLFADMFSVALTASVGAWRFDTLDHLSMCIFNTWSHVSPQKVHFFFMSSSFRASDTTTSHLSLLKQRVKPITATWIKATTQKHPCVVWSPPLYLQTHVKRQQGVQRLGSVTLCLFVFLFFYDTSFSDPHLAPSKIKK